MSVGKRTGTQLANSRQQTDFRQTRGAGFFFLNGEMSPTLRAVLPQLNVMGPFETSVSRVVAFGWGTLTLRHAVGHRRNECRLEHRSLRLKLRLPVPGGLGLVCLNLHFRIVSWENYWSAELL